MHKRDWQTDAGERLGNPAALAQRPTECGQGRCIAPRHMTNPRVKPGEQSPLRQTREDRTQVRSPAAPWVETSLRVDTEGTTPIRQCRAEKGTLPEVFRHKPSDHRQRRRTARSNYGRLSKGTSGGGRRSTTTTTTEEDGGRRRTTKGDGGRQRTKEDDGGRRKESAPRSTGIVAPSTLAM